MNRLSIMLKSYRGDIPYVKRLLISLERHNTESLPFYVVCPHSDLADFKNLIGSSATVLADEDIPTSFANKFDVVDGDSLGIVNAGIVKLAFWELGTSQNYFAIDSDMVFIRDFYMRDFIDSFGRPLLVADQGLSEQIDPFYSTHYWNRRRESLNRVCEIVGVDNILGWTVHNSQIMNSEVLKEFKEDFLYPRDWMYKDAMLFELYEFFWYGAWALRDRPELVNTVQSLVKMIQHQGEHLMLHDAGIREKDLARAYLGVIVNSNWSRQYGIVDFDNPPRQSYLSKGRWADWLQPNNIRGS